ncbi:MAG: hypothetical protein NVS1B13_22630 [Flavisolibacter sp.]
MFPPSWIQGQQVREGRKFSTIVLDPGHGGSDPGAQGLISTEAAICLQISKEIGREIHKRLPGIKVLFTRKENRIPGSKQDINEGLHYRAAFANQSSADLFISIHCNSAGKKPGGWYEKRQVGFKKKLKYKGRKKIRVLIPVYKNFYVDNKTRGTETYLWAANENEQKKQTIGSLGEFENSDEEIEPNLSDPVIRALTLVYTRNYFAKSLKMANLVQIGFKGDGRISRGVKQRNQKGIWVLHATGMPSILIETGFITNQKEEKYLVSKKGQSAIAKTVTIALKRYIRLIAKPVAQAKRYKYRKKF